MLLPGCDLAGLRGSKGLCEVVAADSTTQSLVTGGHNNLFADQLVSCILIERQSFSLKFRSTQIHSRSVASSAFLFCEIQHFSSHPSAPEIRVEVHSAQFHCSIARWLKPEHANDLLVIDGDPEAALPLQIVIRDSIDFFSQRTSDVEFERVFHIRRRQ
jgi:hypothetical protein